MSANDYCVMLVYGNEHDKQAATRIASALDSGYHLHSVAGTRGLFVWTLIRKGGAMGPYRGQGT